MHQTFKKTKIKNKKIIYIFNKPINKKLIIEEISQSITALKTTQQDICYFIEGEVGSGKKYIQHYVTYNGKKTLLK